MIRSREYPGSTGIKAHKISFSEADTQFNFDPINAYHIREKGVDFYVNVFIIVYNLKIRGPRGVFESKIPYYISDGETNHIRANLLFPFICFNEKTREWTSACVNDENKPRGFLFKLSSLINLNHIDEQGRPIITPTENENDTTGLPSVLKRVENFLDFIITTLTSDKIDRANLTPHNLVTFRPFNMPESKDYYYTDIFPMVERNRDDERREKLINYFLEFKNENIRKNYFQVEPCFVILNKKSIVEFNIEQHVCNPERTRNLKASNNYKNYSYISEMFLHSFEKRLIREQSRLFGRIILPREHRIRTTMSLGQNTDGWNAFCSQKEKDEGRGAGHKADIEIREWWERNRAERK